MGFKKTYRVLQEVFPQIDARILRAVAIENSEDADAAVEAVLVEIIPHITLRPDSPLTPSLCEGQSSEGPLDTTQSMDTFFSDDGQNAHNMKGVDHPDYHDGHLERESDTSGLALSGENLETNIQPPTTHTHSHGEYIELVNDEGLTTHLKSKVSGDPETDETILGLKCPESSTKISSDVRNLVNEKLDCGDLETINETSTNKESDQGKSWADDQDSEIVSSSLTTPDLKTSLEDNDFHFPNVHGSNVEKLDRSFSNASNIHVGTVDEPALNASMTQSSQIRIMEVLEETIADAENNKTTLFSGMESVISLMKEVELKEKTAEQAKVEASTGDANILSKLENFKQTVQHAKESNEMHAGEVYGEKAILATELRELQSRVLSLSDERDKSLSLLDEMRQTLEVRLAAAENEIKSAEQEKIENGKAAMKALAEQESIMEKVVQESKVLKQQAEENAMLQEFLVDRGRVVDMLQGEIAVICKDARLLKESLYENVPFSKSLSSSQMSCNLASSCTSTSSKNLNPKESVVPGDADPLVMTQSERGSISCSVEQSSEGELANRDYQKSLVDDGWEIFDDSEVFG